MNIDAILPLLLNKNENADLMKIFAAYKSGDKNKVIETLMPKDKQNEQLLNVLKSINKKPSTNGLNVIESFASNEILGILLKYYSE